MAYSASLPLGYVAGRGQDSVVEDMLCVHRRSLVPPRFKERLGTRKEGQNPDLVSDSMIHLHGIGRSLFWFLCGFDQG